MADDVGSKLGFDASESIAAIQKLKKELDSYNTALANVAGGSDKFNASQTQLDSTLKKLSTNASAAIERLKALSTAQAQATLQAEKFTAAQLRAGTVVINRQPTAFQQTLPGGAPQPFGRTLGEANQARQLEQLRATELALRNVTRGAKESGEAVAAGAAKGAAGAQNLSLSWQSVIRVFGIQFAAQAISSVVNAFQGAIDQARQFEIRLAEIQTISKEFQASGINSVAAVVTSIAAEFGRPVEDVAKGLYQTLSNQIGNAAESVRFLGQAAEFSVATVTTLSDSVDLLSGVLNAYGLTAASTQQVSDILFKTIELGRVTGTELANSLGRVTTVSAQLGVSFQEVASAIATLTIQGVKASDATTQLLNVELKLIKPTENLKAVFQELGVTSGEAGIALFGFQGFLEKITEVGGDAATEIAELFNQIRGTRGVIGLTGTAIEKANQNLKEITESAGATKKAFDLINQTNAQQLTRELESARAFLVDDFGRSAVSVLNNLIQAVGGASNALKILGAVIGTLVSGGLLIFFAAAGKAVVSFGSAILTSAVPAVKALFASLSLTSLGVASLGVAVAAVSAVAIFKLAQAFTTVTDEGKLAEKQIEQLRKASDRNVKEAIAGAQAENDARQRAAANSTKLIVESISKRILALREEQIKNAGLQNSITSGLASNVEERDKLLAKHIDKMKKALETAAEDFRAIAKETDDIIAGIEKNQFERAQKKVAPDVEAQNRLVEAARLEAKAFELARDPAKAKEAFDALKESISQKERVADLTGQEKLGEDALNASRRIAIELETVIKKAKQEQLTAAKAQLELEQKIAAAGKTQLEAATKGKETQTAIQNQLGVITSAEDARLAADSVSVSFDRVLKVLSNVRTTAENTLTAATFGKNSNIIETVDKISGSFEGLRTKVLEALQSGDTAAIAGVKSDLLAKLQQLQETPGITGLGATAEEKLTTGLEALLLKIDPAITAKGELDAALAKSEATDIAAQNLDRIGKAAADGSLSITNIASSLTTLGESGASSAAAINSIATAAVAVPAGLSIAQDAVNSFSTSNILAQVQVAISALQELANAQVGSGGAGGFARGGLIYRAGGGWTPRGTDRIPAMLSKGEFVVNARDSKRFFSELVSINSGRRPIFRQDGGPVTNVTGDININVPDGRGPVDGRQLAMELRRQLRRKTIGRLQ